MSCGLILLRAERIEVMTIRGRVTLMGRVTSYRNKFRAEELAEKVRGVRRVTNLLRIEPALRDDRDSAADNRLVGEADHRGDDAIRGDLLSAFSSDATLREQQIGVTVQDGRVTLTGKVRDFTSKFQAARVATRVRGIRAVDNQLKVDGR